jgi:sugar-specific transcriptional regulator TrmB
MEEIINKLRSLGFTEYESKVFISILQGKLMSASEVADNAGIRRTDVYNILKSFVEKGYINEIETNTILNYEMIDPDIVFDKIQRNIKLQKENELSTLEKTFKDLKPLYQTKQNDKSKIINVELIRGYNKHREVKLIELLKKANKEILFMVRPEIYLSDEIDNFAKEFYKKGGVIKSIYEYGDDYKILKIDKWVKATGNEFIKILKKYEKSGEQIKISKEQVPNITIIDGEIVFTNISDRSLPRHTEADIIIRNKNYAESMKIVFNTFWKSGYSIKDFENIKK